MVTGTGDKLTRKDFASDQETRWCPGCGDYAILAQVQKVMPELGLPREDIVFISGIGCSSRFPYYMNTYGFHSIHGRAPTFATGLKVSRPELSVWVVTGDGDGLSIGGNHLMHVLRRNVDLNIIMFNNRIYGLTKGQYSPTSEQGKVTKSSPQGSVDHPVNPVRLALAAEATWVGRSVDVDTKHLPAILQEMAAHKGVSFLEVYQNCNIFNDGAFSAFADRKQRPSQMLYLEPGQPMVFGEEGERGIAMVGGRPKVVELGDGGASRDELMVHDPKDTMQAVLLATMDYPEFPVPVGVFVDRDRARYEELLAGQVEAARTQGEPDLQSLLTGPATWEVE